MLARICEKVADANVDQVTAALGLDSRIGKKYLKGSIGYGGPCFPRDNRALAAFAQSLGEPAHLAEATDRYNRMQVTYLADFARKLLKPNGRVSILGLSYKPASDVIEESQGYLLSKKMSEEKIPTVVYDPASLSNAKTSLNGTVQFASSAKECIQNSDLVIIATPWEDFKALRPEDFFRGSTVTVIDCWRMLSNVLKEAIEWPVIHSVWTKSYDQARTQNYISCFSFFNIVFSGFFSPAIYCVCVGMFE